MTIEEWKSYPKLIGSKYLIYYVSYINVKMIDRRFSPPKHMDSKVSSSVKNLFDHMSDCGLLTKW